MKKVAENSEKVILLVKEEMESERMLLLPPVPEATTQVISR